MTEPGFSVSALELQHLLRGIGVDRGKANSGLHTIGVMSLTFNNFARATARMILFANRYYRDSHGHHPGHRGWLTLLETTEPAHQSLTF
jgi:hypothetical protein